MRNAYIPETCHLHRSCRENQKHQSTFSCSEEKSVDTSDTLISVHLMCALKKNATVARVVQLGARNLSSPW
jgi:hypothetical protein